jgi:hypothetical protein
VESTRRSPSRSATRIEAAFSGWMRLITCGCFSRVKANRSAARAPSVAYPLPQKARRSVQPSSNPGHPSGF